MARATAQQSKPMTEAGMPPRQQLAAVGFLTARILVIANLENDIGNSIKDFGKNLPNQSR